jgi:hypothetical protein
MVSGLVAVLETADPAGEGALDALQEPILVIGYEIETFHHCFVSYGVLHFSGRGKQRPYSSNKKAAAPGHGFPKIFSSDRCCRFPTPVRTGSGSKGLRVRESQFFRTPPAG